MTNEQLQKINKTDEALFPQTFKGMRIQAKEILESGVCGTAVKKQSTVLAIALAGREFGLGMMTSINSLYVVNGRVTMSAQLMKALAMREGHWMEIVETTAKQCVMDFFHKDRPERPYRHTFTMEDAKQAGNTGKDNYKKHPKNMLVARCTAEGCRIMYPDVMNNMHTPDEMGATVDEEGQVITINQFDDQVDIDDIQQEIRDYIDNPDLASVFFQDWCKESGHDENPEMTLSMVKALQQYVFVRMASINAGDTTIESELETPLDPDPADKPDSGDDEFLTGDGDK